MPTGEDQTGGAGGRRRRPISPSGAFVVVLDGERPAALRILDDEENVVRTYEF